jgi:hypothetical protein
MKAKTTGKQKARKRRAVSASEFEKWLVVNEHQRRFREAIRYPRSPVVNMAGWSRVFANPSSRQRLDKWLEWLEWQDKFRAHFTTPRKLRGKAFPQMEILAWFELSNDDQFFRAQEFLQYHYLNGVRLSSVITSEQLRWLADYIDALKATKSDRGRRLLVTKKLFDYADQIRDGGGLKLSWQELREKFWPDYPDSNANWQKFLRERGIPFDKVGQFRVRKRVRKSRNNTRSPH